MSKSLKLGGKKRHSLPSTSAASSSAGSMWGPPPGGMMMVYPPWMSSQPPSALPTGPQGSQPGGKPWEVSSSETTDTDSDFKAPKKRMNRSKATPAKRGPGRPSKAELEKRQHNGGKDGESRKVIEGYPPAFQQVDQVEHIQQNECRACRIYTGRVALFPCGHGRYCFSCVNTMRDTSVAGTKVGRCFNRNCKGVVTTWMQLFHHSM